MSELANLAYEFAAKNAAWAVLPILIADIHTGEIVYASKFAADTFGYVPQELLGQAIELLVPEGLRDAHARWRQDASVPKTRLMGVGRQIRGRKKDGIYFSVYVGLTTTVALERVLGIAFIIDLTGVILHSEVTAAE